MAGGLDRLEKKLERLERLFSKRRREPNRSSANSNVEPIPPISPSAQSDLIFRTFPPPSFIRPTSNRMVAREEVGFTSRVEQRSHSLPETPSTPRLMSLASEDEADSTSNGGLGQPPPIPKRSSSLSPTRRPGSLASLAELLEFSFAKPTRQRSAQPVLRHSRSRSGSVSPKAQLNRKRHYEQLRDAQLVAQPDRPITPPLSAEFDKSFALDLQAGRPTGELTPEHSPKISVPLLWPEFDDPEVRQSLESGRPRSLQISTSLPGDSNLALRKYASSSDLEATSPKSVRSALREPVFSESTAFTDEVANASTVVSATSKEPSLNEFLALSDDDIADGTPEPSTETLRSSTPPTRSPTGKCQVSTPPSCALPPGPPALVSTPKILEGDRLLTLSPPLATRPATAAAFEAARIATTYKFDLVYVVNLWPNRGSRCEITGRLLAGHGLHLIEYPFRISEAVHLRVLRSDCWLEMHENGSANSVSRGYGCSFYTGHSLRGSPETVVESKERGRKGKTPNRGIVFAAFRRPLEDGSSLETSAAELADLWVEAEALVNMVLRISMSQRHRRPGLPESSEPEAASAPLPLGPLLSTLA